LRPLFFVTRAQPLSLVRLRSLQPICADDAALIVAAGAADRWHADLYPIRQRNGCTELTGDWAKKTARGGDAIVNREAEA
jgi:hypothetical protein